MFHIEIIRYPSPYPVGWGEYPNMQSVIKEIQSSSFEIRKNDIAIIFEYGKPLSFLFAETDAKVEYYQAPLHPVHKYVPGLTEEDGKALGRAWNVFWMQAEVPYLLAEAVHASCSHEFTLRFLGMLIRTIFVDQIAEATKIEVQMLELIESAGIGKVKARLDFHEVKRQVLEKARRIETLYGSNLGYYCKKAVVSPLSVDEFDDLMSMLQETLISQVLKKMPHTSNVRVEGFKQMAEIIRKKIPLKALMKELGRAR